VFIESRAALVLDEYTYSERSTKRHRFKPIRLHDRLSARTFDTQRVTEAEVPWPEDVRKEALDQLVGQLRVARWRVDLGQG
jgi:hypothetical protein